MTASPDSRATSPFWAFVALPLSTAVDLAHAALSVRFILGAIFTPDGQPIALLLFAGAGLAAGWFWTRTAFVALAILAAGINGLNQIALLPIASPLLLLTAAIWLGQAARSRVRPRGRERSPVDTIAVLCDLLRAIVVLSLLRYLSNTASWPVLWQCDHGLVHGYGSPQYPLTSAFIWLHGLAFFRVLSESWPNAASDSGKSFRPAGVLIFATVATMLCFTAIQRVAGIPEGWTAAGFQSPYEDISSYGSIAVACAIYLTATLRCELRAREIARWIGAAAAWIFVVISWSRAAWLTGMTFGLAVVLVRAPLRVSLVAFVLSLAGGIAVSSTAQGDIWGRSGYRVRLLSLLKWESLRNKDSGRSYLYLRALNMISEKPLLGHGIGSFYSGSRRYAERGDPFVNDFAHNFLLQFAVELGILAALLLASLLAIAFGRAIAAYRRIRGSPQALLLAGTALALGAYLQTQLTANSLNVYFSNQIFCWFLVAALVVEARKTAKHRPMVQA